MEDLLISSEKYEQLAKFTIFNREKEVCAFIYADNISLEAFLVCDIIQIRNMKRIQNSFGISKTDYKKYFAKNLVGIYHSHFADFHLSNKDVSIFDKLKNIRFLLVGLYKNNDYELRGYSNSLRDINIIIV